MKNIDRVNLSAAFLFAISLAAGLIVSQNALADADHNVGGFAWTGMNGVVVDDGKAIGWVAFNSAAIDDGSGTGTTLPGGGGAHFGVNIDTTPGATAGFMSGYAWTGGVEAGGNKQGIGWISFNAADAVGCGAGTPYLCSSAAACQPKVNPIPAAGRNNLSGWARVLSVKNEPLNNGGWDGCIYLGPTATNPDGVYIDSNGDFHGYAWTDMVMGWVKFNGPTYRVHTTAKFVPEAVIGCEDSGCSGGSCSSDPWVMYAPTGACADCAFKALNESTGNVLCTRWEILGTSYSFTSAGKQPHTFQPSVPIGENLTVRLTVSDNVSCDAGNRDTTTHLINVRREAAANFECSFDDPNSTSTVALWQDCGDSAFKKKLVKGEKLYLRNISTVSSGASSMVSRTWLVNGAAPTAEPGGYFSFTVIKSNSIRLDVVDNNPNHSLGYSGRHNCKTVIAGAKSLPEWKEISPVGMIWQYLVASVSKIFASL